MGLSPLIMLGVGFWRGGGGCELLFLFILLLFLVMVGLMARERKREGRSNMFRKYCLSINPCDAAVSVSFLYRVFS